MSLENKARRAPDQARAAEELVRRVCRESKKTRAEMMVVVDRIVQAVRECSVKLLDEQGNEKRYLMICRMLRCLETEKRDLDLHLVNYFHMDDAFAQTMIHCLKWEGQWMPSTQENAEIESVGQRIQKALVRLENEKGVYANSRDKLGVLSREILPQFLKEVYRLSDADQNGKGLRAQSVCVLCGELCNHISIEFHK